MTPGVCYFTHSTKHLVRLAASLCSLRRHFSGPVAILDTGTPEAAPAIRALAADGRAGIERVVRIELAPVRRHACYVTKASLWRWSPFPTTVFLDADTVVEGSPIPLGQAAEAATLGLAITSFSDWTTRTPIIRKRLEGWSEIAGLPLGRLQKPGLEEPAINTGVMAWSAEQWHCRHLAATYWEKLTRDGWRRFISDEIAMQVVAHKFRGQIAVLDGRWNHSPTYGLWNYGPDLAEPIIWHFHGGKHERFEKWTSVYSEALAVNFGGLADWAPALTSPSTPRS